MGGGQMNMGKSLLFSLKSNRDDYGPCRQIGLGSNVLLQSIIVPTEIILWRTFSPRVHTKCVDVAAGTVKSVSFNFGVLTCLY